MTDRPHEFHISTEELNCLKELLLQDTMVANLIISSQKQGHKITIQLFPADAERIRELLTERLAMVGFGPNYEVNEKGRLIEELIDRFHVG